MWKLVALWQEVQSASKSSTRPGSLTQAESGCGAGGGEGSTLNCCPGVSREAGLPLAWPGEGWVEVGNWMGEGGEEVGFGDAQWVWKGVAQGRLASVPEGVDVVVQADGGSGWDALTLAALPAAAALDPHHVAGEALTVRTLEAQAGGAGEGGSAAAAVGAGTTGARAIPPDCGAASEGDLDWFLRADGALALLGSLEAEHEFKVAVPNLTESRLSDQPTFCIIIGHSA